jgi:hypothetical protein
MSPTKAATELPPVPPEAVEFARKHGAGDYLYPVLEHAASVYPGRPMTVLFEGDPELHDDWHIVFEADVTDMDPEEIDAGQQRWTKGLFERCPSQSVWIFRLGLTATS